MNAETAKKLDENPELVSDAYLALIVALAVLFTLGLVAIMVTGQKAETQIEEKSK